MNARERNRRQNERLLRVIKENILLAESHKKEGRYNDYNRAMAYVHGMAYACGLLRPQFRWACKISDIYDEVMKEQAGSN